MDKPNEEWERGVDIAGTTKEFFTDKRHYISSDATDNRNLIKKMIEGTLQAGTAHILASVDGKVATTIDKGTKTKRKSTAFEIEHSLCDETSLQRGEHEGI